MTTDHPLPRLLELLSHTLRWQMVQHLIQSDLRVFELVERVNAPMNLVSYHLKKLRDGGVVRTHRSEADGRDIYYQLDASVLRDMVAELGATLAPVLISVVERPADSAHGRVLFLCTHNSARSQIAEALLHQAAPALAVFSAGSEPGGSVQIGALRALADIGIRPENPRPKPVGQFLGQSFDYVITVCDRARESCPQFHGGTHLHWSQPDPVRLPRAEQPAAYAALVDSLNDRVRRFLAQVRAAS